MRPAPSLAAGRLCSWLVLSGVALGAAVGAGWLHPGEVARWFANRPEVIGAFREPHFGNADALILVFSILFLGPLAALLGILVLGFVIAILGGLLLPVVRWFRLPDWLGTLVTVGGLAWLLWFQQEVWLPPAFRFLGLLARAYLTVLGVSS